VRIIGGWAGPGKVFTGISIYPVPPSSLVAVILLSALLGGGRGWQSVLCCPSFLALSKGEFGDGSLQHWLSPGSRGQGTSGGGGSASLVGPIQR
jgi:hypothetical protein